MTPSSRRALWRATGNAILTVSLAAAAVASSAACDDWLSAPLHAPAVVACIAAALLAGHRAAVACAVLCVAGAALTSDRWPALVIDLGVCLTAGMALCLRREARERRFATLVESMPVLVDAFDEDRRIVVWNRECERVTGHSSREMVGRADAFELLYPDPNHRREMFAEWERRGGEFRDWEVELQCKDGSRRVIAWSNVARLTPIPGWHTWAVGIDVTEARRAAESLRRSEERFRALVEGSAEAIALVDADGTVTYSSPNGRHILGKTDQEIVGNTWGTDLHPDDVPATWAAWQRLRADPDSLFTHTSRLRHRDGSWRWIEMTGRNRLDDPAVRGIVVNWRDVTERRQLQEQLVQAQNMEAVSRLAGAVAHDFNNLLTVINGYSDLLAEVLRDQPEARAMAEQIDAAGQRAADLTRRLLAFGRRQAVRPADVDLNEVVGRARELIAPLVREDVVLQLRPASEPCVVHADAGQLEQILLNLAANARDAMPGGGRLLIETAAEGEERVRLSVVDTGCGMSEEVKAHLFEPFFTTKGQGAGTGLGLATVYGIVRQYGGEVRVESEPGRGTAVHLLLPRRIAAAAAVPAGREVRGEPRGTETVLLTEDEAGVRALASHVLREHGYRVLEAADGLAALRLAAAHEGPLHLLLTDVVMPGMNGRELARQLKGRLPALRVLYVSGYNEDEELRAAVAQDAVELLPKPFTPSALLVRVREVLDRPAG